VVFNDAEEYDQGPQLPLRLGRVSRLAMRSLFGSRKRQLSPVYASDKKQHADATQEPCELSVSGYATLGWTGQRQRSSRRWSGPGTSPGSERSAHNRRHQANDLFLIKTGNARFYRVTTGGQDITLLWLGPGDIVGLASLLAEHPTAYLANAETMSPCELLVWDRALIRSFAARQPRIMENGLGLSTAYLRNSLQRHADLATTPSETRV
jgi:CRP-like cAMP-binding protein